MHALPHHYTATASGTPAGEVELVADGLDPIRSASPREFDGPGDRWSPETLLAAAVGDCLVLTFRAVARASKLEWTSLRCAVTGTLDRADGVTRFVSFDVRITLRVPSQTDVERARHVLAKAERNCLISNSLNATVAVTPTIEAAAEPVGEFSEA